MWGTRLASFLFYRIMTSPEDKRFDTFFPAKGELPIKLAGFWSVQATVSCTILDFAHLILLQCHISSPQSSGLCRPR